MKMIKISTLICLSLFLNCLSAENKKIRICRPNNMVSALLYIAEMNNYFEAEGLEPKFEIATNAKICQDMLLAGKADFMNGAEGPFVYLVPRDPPIKIIAAMQKNPETAVFARKDRGIKSFADLKGKNVAYLPGTVSYFFLARVLKKYGLTKADLKLTAMQPPTMPAALIGGAIDAFVMWEPWGAQAAEKLGDNFLLLEDTEAYQYLGLTLATDQILKTDPEMAQKLLKVMQRSILEINQNPDKSFQSLSAAIKFDPVPLKRLWKQYEHFLAIDSSLIDLMKADFALLKLEDPNFKDFSEPKFENFINYTFVNNLK